MIDPYSAHELAAIAQEVGAHVFNGTLRYPSETGGWLLGNADLGEYLDRYRDQQVTVIIGVVGVAPPRTYICRVCGFLYNKHGECPRCKPLKK